MRFDNPASARIVRTVAPFALRGALSAPRELECLSQAVYYEARGEGDGGMAAVAQVVLNRVRHPRFPKSVCGVVFQHAGASCQFSFACDGQVRRRVEGGAWRRAEQVAARALAGAVVAQVGAATDFRGGGGGAPAGLLRVAQIGGHVFYRFAGGLGQPSALRGRVQASLASERPVLAGFIPPSAEQLVAAGAKVVERAAAAVAPTPRPSGVDASSAGQAKVEAAPAPVVIKTAAPATGAAPPATPAA